MPTGLYNPSSEVESIVGIQFGILSPEEIEKGSVVQVTTAATYDGNEPKVGGLFDPRMGVLENGKICRSCGNTNHNCPGHFGHYVLARPVYYIQFFDYIKSILRCVCIRCSKLLIDKENNKDILKKRGEARWREVLKRCSSISRCGQENGDGCGAPQPAAYNRDGIARIIAKYNNPTQETINMPLEVEYVQRLFRRVLDEDVDFMGFNHRWCRPDWMICSVLQVAPPQVRPSVLQDNNQRAEDDLTHKYYDIIKSNIQLEQKIQAGASKHIIDDLTNVLQYHIATLVDNNIPGVAPSAQRSGRPLKSVAQRLGSKEGRIRYNIQGKRVEFSARSVISGDPRLSIAEIGMPLKIAMNLTKPERVTPYNRARLYKYVQNGADKYPGAKTIVRSDGHMISLKHVNTKEIMLYHGDVVNRHIIDGDILLFNRQPTLHRMSMMGHKVKVLPFNTFRMNVSTTGPYNADFDGDEMNAHIPQSYEASIELEEIAAVPRQIISPRHAKPVIGIVQDTLVGSYLLTQNHIKFNKREFMNLMMWNDKFNGKMPQPRGDGNTWTGQQVLSTLLPALNMEMGNTQYDDDPSEENKVIIREGDLVQGVVDKDIYGKASKGIIHVTYNDYGPKEAVRLIDSLQNTVEHFLILNGFSVGISDLIADEATKNNMDDVIQECKKKIADIILQVHLDLFDNKTGKTNKQEFEERVFAVLNDATKNAGGIGQKSLSKENRMTAMVRAGSKGGALNIAQMIALVGQQNVEGKRVPYGFDNRTLPHYKKYDDGAEARGFIESSFIKGLTPQEFYFHAMSGREGLIDTAVKTADTGYTQRQLVKAMEDLVTHHDGSVRDANMNVVQFHYGEDGINATKIESIGIDLHKLSEEEIRTEFGSMAPPAYVEAVIEDRKMLIERMGGNKIPKDLFSSVNISRILQNIKIRFKLQKGAETDLTPENVIEGINKIIGKTQKYHRLWAAFLRFHCAPHKLISQGFTKTAFDTFAEMVIVQNWKAWAQPGEQVGILAAQSIGEPSTQMSTLNRSYIIVKDQKSGHMYSGPVGEYIDSLLNDYKEDVTSIGNDSVVLDLPSGYTIIGVSEDEKVSWKSISQVSRHPANGGLVKVTTRSGRTTTATLTHSFLKRSKTGIVPVLGSDLKIGMRIPIARVIPEAPGAVSEYRYKNTVFKLNKEFGWLCGIYLADGSFNGNTVRITKVAPIVEEKLRLISSEYGWEFCSRLYQGEYGPGKDNNIKSKILRDFLNDTFGSGSYEKRIGSMVYNANKEFIAGLLSGYFDGDGNVNAEKAMIRASSRSEDLIRDIARLMGYVGVFGTIASETSVRIPDKVQHTIIVNKKHARLFKDNIGLNLPEKVEALDAVIEYIERDDKHSSQEQIDKIPELGEVIAETGKLLKMPGQSRTYGRWLKKESIGRATLEKYLMNFRDMMEVHVDEDVKSMVEENLRIIESALDADVVWDEITELEILEDPKEYVYDFTVPGNDSFMVDDNILVHNTLNTFHLAGVASKSNVTRGVPRLKELLKVTRNPKATSLTVYLKKEFRDNRDKARQVVQDLELTLLRDIAKSFAIYYDPKDESIIKEDRELLEIFKMFELSESAGTSKSDMSKWLFRIEFDRTKMFNKNITINDVVYVLQTSYPEIGLTYSDYNSQKLIMRIRIPTEMGDSLEDLKALENKILNGVILRGIPGIKAAVFNENDKLYESVDGKYQKIEQYVIETDGSNFVEVMNHPAVDGNRLYSTHVHDVYNILGIEATRAILHNEIAGLFMEAGVNYRHLGLLCDVMTRAGNLMSIDRYGINKMNIGPLAKASFEETGRILLKASLFGEMDPVTGVSANIMTGQTIRSGTSFTQILLDEAALGRVMKGLPPAERLDEEEVDMSEIDRFLVSEVDDPCARTEFQMNLAMPPEIIYEDEPDVEMIISDA
jgi:DNA-directed RNA polymerase II subunit RPB1